MENNCFVNNDLNLNNFYINVYEQNELANAIIGAKKLIDKYVRDFSLISTANFDGYQQVYISTNELICEYLDLIDLSKKNKALSVTSSGDHMFNLVTKGILNIDTFDSNKLTEYFAFGLKRTMIIKYDYLTYINMLKTFCNRTAKCETITKIIFELLPLMDIKYRIFWKEIIDYNNKIQKDYGIDTNIFSLLCMGFHPVTLFISNNNYLNDAKNYYILKNNITKANISFTSTNALDIPKTFDGKKYDLILLSNILDYFSYNWGYDWNIDKLNDYTEKLQKLIDNEGIIFLNYIYHYKYLSSNLSYIKNHDVIKNSAIKYGDLNEYEILELQEHYENIPALLLKRN